MTVENPEKYSSTETVNSQYFYQKSDSSDPNQLTTMTVISLSPEFNFKNAEKNGVDVDKGKSLDSVLCSASETKEILKKEKWYSVGIQIFIPFMIAGVGTIGAGVVLGKVEEYKVFKEVRALYVLVPALLGLKGNLDMCLASRLSTQANLGNMKGKKEVFKMIIGNIGLVQIQAIVASCIVSVFAIGASVVLNGHFRWSHAYLVTASSVLTATLSCFTLDFVLITVIFISHRIKLNPDNLATPLAASIGDVVSLLVLSSWARLLFNIHEHHQWVMFIILAVFLLFLLPGWVFIVRKNDYTKNVLYRGWTPVLSALFISGTGGLVLDQAVNQFPGYVTFQPIINGIGGNLVSVQASRTSTMLHKTSIKGVIPPHTKQWVAPWTALLSGVFPAKTARLLLAMSVPGQVVFVLAADLISNDGQLTAKFPFVLAYLSVSLIQLMILLYTAHLMVHTMWKMKIDPDNSAIPYLTALGDLLGSTLLLSAFVLLKSLNWEYDSSSE
ncbi:solute carrier family 41 member 1-like [Anthonomus grandis grandis]|uniref:solute carrier family 41 member 1-like n=1 Tax=Anthonomus grandis grandis TaxID=2921223 RepID=UPI002165FD37|nr:solute carrier family 41 member 1-like [Anthonomus grandis grandis]